MTDDAVGRLNDRERTVLRLLLDGHDAKSIARHLDLSVHTVNERLRDARRTLGVASSREAARRLAAAEGMRPQFRRDEDLGVARDGDRPQQGIPQRSQGGGRTLALFAGGMLVMSLVIAAAALSIASHAPLSADAAPPAAAAPAAVASPGVTAARAWLALVDQGGWDRIWDVVGTTARTRVTQAQWIAAIRSARQPLGATRSRALTSDTRTNTLPGLPAGDYEIAQFRADFADKPDTIETITLAREASGWTIIGYFVR